MTDNELIQPFTLEAFLNFVQSNRGDLIEIEYQKLTERRTVTCRLIGCGSQVIVFGENILDYIYDSDVHKK